MRVLTAGLAVLLLAACSPGPQSPPASSHSASAAATSAAPAIASSAEPPACRVEIGDEAARDLADRCRMVSPATHPPCHPDNSCRMIQDEIDRSCRMWDKDPPGSRPKECTA